MRFPTLKKNEITKSVSASSDLPLEGEMLAKPTEGGEKLQR